MTNLKYVEEIMSADMSAEAQAMALSLLVNQQPSQRCRVVANSRDAKKDDKYWFCVKDGNGAEYSKNIVNSRLLTIALPMLQDTENGVRAKDIAKAYNDTFDPWSELTHHDTRHILLKLLDCGIVKYENREEKVEIVDRRGLKREILTTTRYYFLNI
jgi:hypothetical protein